MNKIALSVATTMSVASLFLTSSVLAQTNTVAPAMDTPTVKVVTPQEGQTVYGDRIPILFATENFQVVDYTQYKTNQKGQGHIHVWLDDQNPTMESAKKVTSDNTLYTDVPYGNHTLKVELVNNNHTSLTPPVVVTVNFKTAPIASATQTAPASSFDKNTALVILVVVALVIVAAWWYTKDEDEQVPAKGGSASGGKVESQSRKSAKKTTAKRTTKRKKK